MSATKTARQTVLDLFATADAELAEMTQRAETAERHLAEQCDRVAELERQLATVRAEYVKACESIATARRLAETSTAEQAKRAYTDRRVNRPEPIEARTPAETTTDGLLDNNYVAGYLQSMTQTIVEYYEAGDETSLRMTLERAKGFADALEQAWNHTRVSS